VSTERKGWRPGFGEIIAVLAVTISGLTLWNNYDERTETAAERAAEAQSESARSRTLVLRGAREDEGRRLALAPVGEQVIQSQQIAFPTAFGVDPVETVSDPRIEARWFEDGLKRALKAAGRKTDASAGDARLPVAVTTRYIAGGKTVADVSVYEIGYGLQDRFLRGAAVKMRGLSFAERSSAKGAQRRIDALWKGRS
jgi:hypothetical protein